MAVRIYTLAKELNLDSKVLVEICDKAGITGKGSALASLSDEAFVHDYQPLPAGCGRQQPVLIGLCREQTLRERLRLCADVGLRHDGLAMTGLAMVSAYCWCHPEAAHAPQPVLLLDLGKDNSTAVVLAGGQPLFIGSLLFNAERFQQALATRHGASKYDEKPSPERVNLLDEAPNSALLVAARQLETEIHNAVEHWRNQEQAEMASALIEQVYVCGGGSLLGGLDAWLADRLEIKARDLFMALRVAVTGTRVSPPLFESMEILGREKCLDRIAKAIQLLR